jgi:hypothetical protein
MMVEATLRAIHTGHTLLDGVRLLERNGCGVIE